MELLENKDAIDRVKTALANTSEADRFMLLAKIEISKDKNLKACRPVTILTSLIKVASLGLYIGTGEAYLVPYKDTCTLQIGYLGMIKLLYRGGMKSIKVNTVHENDKFEFEDGTETRISHIRALKDRGEMICAYAVAKIKDDPIIEIMDKAEIDYVKDNFGNSKTWNNFYGEMAKKTVIRRLFKKMPLENFDLQTIEAIKSEEAATIEEANDNPSNNSEMCSKSQMLAAMI